MAIVYFGELPRERSASNERNAVAKYTRGWLVRVDDQFESQAAIVGEVVGFGETHPENAESYVDNISCKTADDSGLAYVVTATYSPLKKDEPEPPEDPENPPPPGPGDDDVAGLKAFWSGSSSVITVPAYTSLGNITITNSAGDPFVDGIEKEQAEPKLQFTGYYALAATWWDIAIEFTNSCNVAVWNGGAINTWKCQGASGKWLSDKNTWEVTFDFVYRADDWYFKPWDLGFREYAEPGLDAEDIESYEGYSWTGSASPLLGQGGTVDATIIKRQIKGPDGKIVRTPAALHQGKAKEPGEPPETLIIQLYALRDFVNTFGELANP